jgi:serine/threonine protein kinase
MDDDVVKGLLEHGYHVIKQLGKGAQGTVVLCREAKTDELVAVKLLHRDLLHNKYVRTEVRAASSRGTARWSCPQASTGAAVCRAPARCAAAAVTPPPLPPCAGQRRCRCKRQLGAWPRRQPPHSAAPRRRCSTTAASCTTTSWSLKRPCR